MHGPVARCRRALIAVACGASAAFTGPVLAQGFDLRSLIPEEGPRERVEKQRRQRDAEQKLVCHRVRGWFDEGPLNLTPGHIGPAEQNAAVLLLLEDGRFARAFGKTYAQTSAAELNVLTRDVVPRCIDAKNAPSTYYNDIRSVAYAALDPQRQAATLRQLSATHSATAALQALTDELQALPVNEQGYARLGTIRQVGEAPMKAADRHVVTDYELALAGAEARVAAPLQTVLVRDTIAQSSGHEGLAQLARLSTDLQRRSPPSVTMREKLLQINVRMEQIASAMLAIERERIDKLGDGMQGLERGVQWQATFDVRYRPFAAAARPLNDIQAYFVGHRAAVLDSAHDEFASLARRATADEQLDALERRYLIASDRTSVTGAQLLSVIADQRHEIETLGTRGALRDQDGGKRGSTERIDVGAAGNSASLSGDVSLVAPRGATALVPVDLSREPAEDVMLDLVRTRYQNEVARLRRATRRCAPGRGYDTLACGTAPGFGEAALDAPFTITRFKKRSCTTATGRPGYLCQFEYAVAGGPAKIVSTITQSLGGEDGVAAARFAPRDGDWVMITAH